MAGAPESMRPLRRRFQFGLTAVFFLVAISAVGMWLRFPTQGKPYLKVAKADGDPGPKYVAYLVVFPDRVTEGYWVIVRDSAFVLEEIVVVIDGTESRRYKARGDRREAGWAGEISDCMRERFKRLQTVVAEHVDLDDIRWKDDETPTHLTEVKIPLQGELWSQARRNECFGLDD